MIIPKEPGNRTWASIGAQDDPKSLTENKSSGKSALDPTTFGEATEGKKVRGKKCAEEKVC